MKRPEGTDVKNYCHRSPECEIVTTGINLLEFHACKVCKYECSQALKDRVEKKDGYTDKDTESNYYGWGI